MEEAGRTGKTWVYISKSAMLNRNRQPCDGGGSKRPIGGNDAIGIVGLMSGANLYSKLTASCISLENSQNNPSTQTTSNENFSNDMQLAVLFGNESDTLGTRNKLHHDCISRWPHLDPRFSVETSASPGNETYVPGDVDII